MTFEEIKALVTSTEMTAEQKNELIEILSQIECTKKEEYTFEFEAISDPRKGVPYVAKMVLEKGNLSREFFDLKKQYGKKEVTVYGKYQASEGDIIEIREGGSWKNDYRYFFIVKEGKLEKFGSSSSSTDKLAVEKYLRDRKN